MTSPSQPLVHDSKAKKGAGRGDKGVTPWYRLGSEGITSFGSQSTLGTYHSTYSHIPSTEVTSSGREHEVWGSGSESLYACTYPIYPSSERDNFPNFENPTNLPGPVSAFPLADCFFPRIISNHVTFHIHGWMPSCSKATVEERYR